MAYPRRTYKKKFVKRSKPKQSGYMDKAISLGKAAYKGYSLAKTAIGLINAEHKYVDVNQSAVLIPNGGTFTLLSGIANGDSASQRDGSSVKLTDMYMRFRATQVTAGVNNYVRVTVFRQALCNGNTPTTGQLFENNGTNLSSYNKDFMGDQFEILFDKFLTLYNDKPLCFYKKKIQINKHEKFVSTDATLNSVSTGAIWMLVWGSSSNASPGQYDCFTRVNYLDN